MGGRCDGVHVYACKWLIKEKEKLIIYFNINFVVIFRLLFVYVYIDFPIFTS